MLKSCPLLRFFLLVVTLVCASPLPAQSAADQLPPAAEDSQLGRDRERKDPDQEKREHDMEKARNKERQQALQKDTTQLLQLATELKQYVDKTNENTLSVDVIKKAEEIEKLAHKVKEKMRSN
jgi:hypothetical protein